jgi:hypothetical protein
MLKSVRDKEKRGVIFVELYHFQAVRGAHIGARRAASFLMEVMARKNRLMPAFSG